MPVYEVERDGRTFEVDAPNPQMAVTSIKRLLAPAANVGGLPETASPIDYARDSMQVANALTPEAPVGSNTPQGFAALRAQANADMMQGGSAPPERTGDFLRPAFGGHNPIAETYDAVIDPFIPTKPRGPQDRERQEWLDRRGIGERAIDAANFTASLPVRMATQGRYGLGDVISAVGLDGSGISEAEGDFVRANAPQLGAVQAVGDAALGAFGASVAPVVPRGPAKPRATLPERPSIAENARAASSDLASFEAAHVPVFGPAFSSSPAFRATAKGLSDTFGVGVPLQNALENSYRGARDATQRVAGQFGDARTAKEVGDTAGAGLERFKDARAIDVVEDAVSNLPDNRLSEIIATPTSTTSMKTKQAALYERAWRQIPEEMRRGRAVEGETRVMQSPANARAVLEEIMDRNARMMLQSGQNAAPRSAARPVQGGQLGYMIDAILNQRYTANLQTLRDLRSEFRRLASGMADTEKNTLKLSDIERIQSGLTQDMIALLRRNAEAYRAAGNTQQATGFVRAAREFARADRFTRLSMERLEAVERLFKAESSEALARNISNAALAGGKGNVAMLRSMHRILRPEERGEIAAGVIAEMGRPGGSARGLVQDLEFSVEAFMTRWNNMTPESRALLFGPEHAKALNDLVAVSRRLANVESFANRSNTFRSGGNVLGIAATVGTALSGGLSGVLYLAGAVGGTYALSYLLSRPAYAKWATRYLRMKAGLAYGASEAKLRTPVIRHIGTLARFARNDPALASIIVSLATHEKIDLKDIASADDAIGASVASNERFSPPMRAGLRDLADGAFTRTAPTPGNVPPAEARPYTPSPSESAAFYARQGAEAIGVPATQAEQFGSGVGNAVNLFTPTDAVSDALQTGSAASAAEAGLSFIPGFRGGRKAAEKALELARKELDEIEREASRLFSDAQVARIMGPSPVPAIPGRAVPDDVMLAATKDRTARLQKAIEDKRNELARRPQSNTSVPVTTTAQQREVSRFIEDTPTIAIPGRQGFATKEEQRRLVRQHFESGGDLSPAPWGRTPEMARDHVKRLLAEAHAAGKKVSKEAEAAIENAAKKADEAASEARELRLFAEATPGGGKELKDRLLKAETEAAHWKAQYDALWRKLFGEG